LGFKLAKELSRQYKSLLVELPCLGIPRLGFISNIMDRDRHTEAAILDLDKEKALDWALIHRIDGLSLLPANVFAAPDYPISAKVDLNTLIEFPGMIIEEGQKKEYQWVFFDCQGQLTNPMTFFALKKTDKVMIPVENPGDAAYALANIKRLVNIFKHPADKFFVLANEDLEEIKKIMVLKDEIQGREYHVHVIPQALKSMVEVCGGSRMPVLERDTIEYSEDFENHLELNEIFYESRYANYLKPDDAIRIQL
jgi:cellulose biosynthesis protein BcsQ